MKQKKESSSSSHDSEEENAAPVSLKMQSLPSTRYFNKRISVDFHDIKTIEKPRRLSSLFPSNLSNNLSEEKGYVKFSTIDEEIKVNINSEVKPPARKGGLKKSILKNTIIQDAVKLDNLFDQGIKGVNGEIVSKIEKMGEKEEDKYLFSISLCFLEHLKALKNNIQKIFVCLKGIDSSFLNILVRDGMDLDMFQSFLNAMRENITGNEEWSLKFLDNLSKVKHFNFCLNSLDTKEENNLKLMFDIIEKGKLPDEKFFRNIKGNYITN